MKLVTKDNYKQLQLETELDISNIHFIDDMRLGISLLSIGIIAPKEISLQNININDWQKFSLFDSNLRKDGFYLGFSKQKLSLPKNVFGYLHTRSKYARLGLDFLNSSNFVSPGFGFKAKERLVFEISTKIELQLIEEEFYVGLVLFQIESNINLDRNFSDMFPLNLLDEGYK